MTDIDTDFSGSIPEIYDSHLVPILFERYADDLADRVAQTDPTAVLEVAAGSGAVTRALAPRLSEHARYVVTDDDRRFQAVARALPDTIEPVRLYESYLSNFRFAMGR
jgi:ubiquinone/menaquinone biosynthesis C-methylase UbiE